MAESVTPGVYRLRVYQGASLDRTFTWRDENKALIDLTGFTARAQIRSRLEGGLILDMTTTNSRIVLGGVAGTIQLVLTATETDALHALEGVWDLELIDAAGVVTRLLEGQATIFGQVSR